MTAYPFRPCNPLQFQSTAMPKRVQRMARPGGRL
jgi:hypothetical protein